ncbi:MAG: hypothetical protein KKE73_03345 [Proteobacteria bacterium]|nr:hypothetical protein [Pseudomonadota bacterium]
MNVLKDRYKRVAVEVHCPIHKVTKVIYLPEEEMPTCPICKKPMIIKEVLSEGKY